MPQLTEDAYETYKHHTNEEVWVRKDLRGKHRDHCLCYECARFTPNNRSTHCPIAYIIYRTCVRYNVVTPVWECPNFDRRLS